MAKGNALNLNSVNPLALEDGGTGTSMVALNGAIAYTDDTKLALLAPTATQYQPLMSGSNGAPSWSTATYPATTAINQLLYSSANNVIGGLATANSAALVTSSSGVPAFTAPMTDGQVLIGQSGGTPVPATLTAGTGISITNDAGSVTIESIAEYVILNVEGNSQLAAVNRGYVIGSAAVTTVTLPDVAALGSVVEIIGNGALGWILVPGAGQTINVGSTAGTTSVTSANRYDCIRLVCTVADTTWVMTSAVTSGFTVV